MTYWSIFRRCTSPFGSQMSQNHWDLCTSHWRQAYQTCKGNQASKCDFLVPFEISWDFLYAHFKHIFGFERFLNNWKIYNYMQYSGKSARSDWIRTSDFTPPGKTIDFVTLIVVLVLTMYTGYYGTFCCIQLWFIYTFLYLLVHIFFLHIFKLSLYLWKHP